MSTLKNSKIDSPKTPGGISKALLTPCRRVGLSRNWKKSGASPFQSPLASNAEQNQEKAVTRKRKESLEEITTTSENIDACESPSEAVQTPIKTARLSRRTKSKTLLSSINQGSEENVPQSPADDKSSTSLDGKCVHDAIWKETSSGSDHNKVMEYVVTPPVRLKSKSKSKPKISPSNSCLALNGTKLEENKLISNSTISIDNKVKEKVSNKTSKETKENSPNNLTKECIVVIQKKIFKNELKEQATNAREHRKVKDSATNPTEIKSQSIDSDSDDKPLISLSNNKTVNKQVLQDNDEDADFIESTFKIHKPINTKSPKVKTSTKSKTAVNKKEDKMEVHIPATQSSTDDDDFIETKRTILIKKSYDKVVKPHKAKSTGSITQKDIDDLKARIEIKKKLLLARAKSDDTQELTDLIKKWQKGCQDALMQLMDLMKKKVPDKENMDYSEMLRILKIPASLVGYDSDNDCFLTPNDESIVLSHVNG